MYPIPLIFELLLVMALLEVTDPKDSLQLQYKLDLWPWALFGMKSGAGGRQMPQTMQKHDVQRCHNMSRTSARPQGNSCDAAQLLPWALNRPMGSADALADSLNASHDATGR